MFLKLEILVESHVNIT